MPGRKKPGGQASRGRGVPSLREALAGYGATLGWLLFIGVTLGAVAAGAQWMLDPRNLPLREVVVEGEFRFMTARQIRETVSRDLAAGFLQVDVARARAAVAAMPWVEQVRVRRVWPDRLAVRVTERRPAARWGETGVLSTRGALFFPDPDSVPEGLPRLSGPDSLRPQVMEQYVAMLEALAPLGRSIASLSLDARRAWHLVLDNGVEVQLGRTLPLARLERFVRVYPLLVSGDRGPVDAVDMRYANGLAVRRRAEDATANQRG